MPTLHDDDLAWLAGQRPHVTADPAAYGRALNRLEFHIESETGPGAAPAAPTARRRRPLARRLAIPSAVGVAAVGGLAAAIATGSSSAPPRQTLAHAATPTVVHHRHTAVSPLITLAADVTASAPLSGNATLITRTTQIPGKAPVTVYDLYTDAGEYFFSPTRAGLPEQVSENINQADGMFAREIAAAKEANGGSAQQAAEDLADAPNPQDFHFTPPSAPPTEAQIDAVLAKASADGHHVSRAQATFVATSPYDNYVWEDAQDALIAGAGQPDVRAGVLEILATLPGVSVTNTTTDGVATLTLTAGTAEVGAGYQEQLVINAQTGVPISFTGGVPGQAPATSVTYGVARVDTANLGG